MVVCGYIKLVCIHRFQEKLKLNLSAVGKFYLTCALLTNARTCLYGNITSQYFEIDPPSLEDYFV